MNELKNWRIPENSKPIVDKRLFRRPLHNMTDYMFVDKETHYPHHPPTYENYTVYWAIMIRLNLTEAMITDENYRVSPAFLEKIRAVQSSIMPLVSVFMKFWEKNGKMPDDHQTSVEIHILEKEVPIYGRWARYPDFNIEYFPRMEDRIDKFTYQVVIENPSPAKLVESAMKSLCWWNETYEQGFNEDFEEARLSIRSMFGVEERRNIYNNFKHFKVTELDPEFVFQPTRHSILFCALWRINKAYDLLNECMKQAFMIDIGVKKLVSPLESEEITDYTLPEPPQTPNTTDANPFCMLSMDNIEGTSESARKLCVNSCFIQLIEEIMSFDPNRGVPFSPMVQKRVSKKVDFKGKRIYRKEAQQALVFHSKIKTEWVRLMLIEAVERGDALVEKFASEAATDGESFVFMNELYSRGLRSAVAAVDRFKATCELIPEGKNSHTDFQKRQSFLHRFRLILPTELRETLFYPLKKFIATHNDLLMYMIVNKKYLDIELQQEEHIGEVSACIYDVYLPTPHRHVSEDYWPDHGPLLTTIPFFEKTCTSTLPIVKTYWNALTPSLYERSHTRQFAPEATNETASHYAWLNRVQVVVEMGTYRDSNTFANYEQMLRAYISSINRDPQKTSERIYGYRQTAHNQILCALMASLRNSPALFASIMNKISPSQMMPLVVNILNDDAIRLMSSSIRTDHIYLESSIQRIINFNLLKPKRKNRTAGTTGAQQPSKRLRTSLFREIDILNTDPRKKNVSKTKKTATSNAVENQQFCKNIHAVIEHMMQLQPVNKDSCVLRKTQAEYLQIVVDSYLQASKKPKSSDPGLPTPIRPLQALRQTIPQPIIDEVVRVINQLKPGEEFNVNILKTIADKPNQENEKNGVEERYLNMSDKTCADLANLELNCRGRSPEKLSQRLKELEPYEKYLYYLACNVAMQHKWMSEIVISDAVEVARKKITIADTLGKRPDCLTRGVDGNFMATKHNKRVKTGIGLNSIGAKGVRDCYLKNTYEDALGPLEMLTKQRENLPQPPVSISLDERLVLLKHFSRTPGFGRNPYNRHGHGAGASKEKQLQLYDRSKQDKLSRHYMTSQSEIETEPFGPPIMGMQQAPRPMPLPEKKSANALYNIWKIEEKKWQVDQLEECGESITIKPVEQSKRLLVSIPSTAEESATHYLNLKKTQSIFICTCCGHQVQYTSKLYGPWPRTYCGYCKSKKNQIAQLPHCYSCKITPVIDKTPMFHLLDESRDRFVPIFNCTVCTKAFSSWRRLNWIASVKLLDCVCNKDSNSNLTMSSFEDGQFFDKGLLSTLSYKTHVNELISNRRMFKQERSAYQLNNDLGSKSKTNGKSLRRRINIRDGASKVSKARGRKTKP